MTGYQHREESRARRTEVAKSRTIYNTAVMQANRIISKARQQAHNIRIAAIMQAEQDAKAIREAARAEGLALADTETAADEARRRAVGQQRLQLVTDEIYSRQLKDAS